MPDIVCQPSKLLASSSCLGCLSEKELLAVIVYAISTQSSYSLPAQVPNLLKDSACFACMSEKDLLQAVAALQVNLYLESMTVPQIMAQIKCLNCTSQKQLQAALTFLLCETAPQQFMNSNVLASGVVTLVNGSYTVNNVNANTAYPIFLTYYSLDGSQATLSYGTIVAGTSFVITSSNSHDTNLAAWVVLTPS